MPRRPSPASAGHTPTFASLRVYNYRLFFCAALLSNIGTWMGRTAQSWLVLTDLTAHSATALGIVTALQFGPMLFLAPYGGVIADRFPKRTILLVTQLLIGVNQLVLWGLVVTHHAQLWHVYALALLLAATTAFDNPARQAFASEMVGPDLLANAVGLNSASFNFARLIGPGLAGLFIAWWGVGPAMLINGLSFVAVIAALLAMRPDELVPAPPRRGGGAFMEGVRYLRHRPDVILLTALIFVFGALGMNFQVTNLLMTTVVFRRGAEAYGLVGSIMAIGSLTGALLAARRTRPRISVTLWALAGFTALMVLLALTPSYLAYCIVLIPVGMVSITAMNNANATIQLTVAPEVRGRVLSLYMALFMGSTLIGAPIIGWVGDAWGPRWTLLVGGLGTGAALVVAAAWLAATGQLNRNAIRATIPWHRGVSVDPSPAEAVVEEK